MGDEPHHECGFAMLRLLKPWEYYKEKYGTSFYGLNRMYLMMEKQRNRGQDGCGIANVKLDVPPGVKYIHCEKSIAADPIKDVFERVQKMGHAGLQRAPPEALITPPEGGPPQVDPLWVKEHVPFAGELFLSHVRYGTDSDNSIDRCHPVMRESNWMTRSLLLAGNFNITNNEDLFSSLVQIGQHPRELSDTVTLLEKIGHFVDKENNDLYVKYSATGQAPRTCFSLIAENLNVARVLRRASSDWDGGYCIAGVLGHGDSFVLRDPCGIRPAFYMANDEVIVVASEAPLIQTVFGASEDSVHPLPPGQALVIKRSGNWKLESVLAPQPLKQCSFERIYFSRGNDAGVYRQREHLGRLLLAPLMKILEADGDSLANTVLSFIPNTAELAFNGLVKEAQDEMSRRRAVLIKEIMEKNMREGAGSGFDVEEALQRVSAMTVRTEKVVHKDAKIRTFIQEDSSREGLTMHAYDVHYGTVRAKEDVLVALDDSIVRGNTLKNAILRTLDRLGPKSILVLSSCPQIRYPDVYGIDMAKMGDLAAFKAAVTMLQERGQEGILAEVYRACRSQLSRPLASGDFVNHVRRVYEPFTPDEISAKICQQVTPAGCKAKIGILFNTVDALHVAMPEFAGDWYFTGNYPTPGGTKVCCRAFVLWFEGSSARCYGVSSAASCAQTPVLVVGNGGSEHALAWKLSQSHEVGCVYVAPGNGGISGQTAHGHAHRNAEHDDAKGSTARVHSAPVIPVDVPLTPPHFKEVKDFCRERSIVLAVVGSEQLLHEGLADVLRSAGVPTFGPSQAAAELESSQAFSKTLVQKLGLPMAAASNGDGDASGFPEVSVLAFSDGVNFAMVPAATQDQKRCNDEDRGPVTDGMGAFAPSPLVDEEMLKSLEENVLRPLFDAMRSEGRHFSGCLQTELVLTPSGPRILGFKTSISEPVAQAMFPLLDGDLFEVLSACAGSRLKREPLTLRRNQSTVAVVLTSGGYPGPFQSGHAITGIERALCVPGAHVFHTGTTVEIAEGVNATPTARRSFTSNNSYSFSQKLMTCGGRVMTVAAIGRSLHEARERAYVAVRAINFTDAHYRHDIAALASLSAASPRGKTFSPTRGAASDPNDVPASQFTYRSSGVDKAACEAALRSFEPLMRRTVVASAVGATPKEDLMKASVYEMDQGMMISSASAIGTKLKVAAHIGNFDSLGVDLVALCVNDIAARGAETLFFHDHISTEKLDAHQVMQLVKGVSDGCVEAGCRLLDAGVAELPGVFAPGGFDFVGFAVGMAEKGKLLPQREAMVDGDVLIALPSSGLHSNGFSLVRAIIKASGLEYSQAAPFDPTRSLGDALMPPTRIYAKSVLALARAGLLRGAVQVAHGGLEHCFDAVLPPHFSAQMRADAWELPAVVRWLAAVGKVPCRELISTFNCGLGMILVVPAASQETAMTMLTELHEEPLVVGKLVSCSNGAPRVEVEGAQGSWLMLPELGVSLPFPEVLSSLQDPWTVCRMKVLILAGGEGVSAMQALFSATKVPASAASLVAVASPDPDSKALVMARANGVRDIVLGEGRFKEAEFFCEGLDALDDDLGSPTDAGAGTNGKVDKSANAALDFSEQLDKTMDELQAELLVVMDDVDSSLLTKAFVQRRAGKILLCHASLLPAFAGPSPIEAALRAGVCVTGCTVSFAVPPSLGLRGNHHGPQILQEPIRIESKDTAVTLRQRLVTECEAPALPRALQLVASGSVALRCDDEGYGLGRSASFSEAASAGMLNHGSIMHR